MLERVFDLAYTALTAALRSFESIIAGMNGGGYFVAIFIFVLAIDLFIMPVRGGSTPYMGDFTASPIAPKQRYVSIYKNRLGTGKGYYLPEGRKQLPEARKHLPSGRLSLPSGK